MSAAQWDALLYVQQHRQAHPAPPGLSSRRLALELPPLALLPVLWRHKFEFPLAAYEQEL